MKQFLLFLFLGTFLSFQAKAQQITLKKGIILDTVPINDSIPDSFALYLPKNFENTGKWPVLFVFDMEGKAVQALRMFQAAAEERGYILAASNNVSDTLSIPKNIVIANNMFNRVFSLFPIHASRVYTAGFDSGARFASVIPTFIKQIEGVIACGAGIPRTEILSGKNRFHFIGIVGREDYNYSEMLTQKKVLNRLKFPNHRLFFDGGREWPQQNYIAKAMEIFTLAAMAKGNIKKDSIFINKGYAQDLRDIKAAVDSNKLVQADDLMGRSLSVYRSHLDIDSLMERRRLLRKEKSYRAMKRNENNLLFKESLIKEDYGYYLEEDVLTYNFNNLGWWNYQMQELEKFCKSQNEAERQMGKRLRGFVNALIADNIDIVMADRLVDVDALHFLWMLKTITAPKEYSFYLKIISSHAKNEDFGTALFYLEELLKNGYTDRAALYKLEDTALLRITPEFNRVVAKYLKGARYDVNEE